MIPSLTEPQCNIPWITLRILPVLWWHQAGNDHSPKRVYNLLLNQIMPFRILPYLTKIPCSPYPVLLGETWGDSLNSVCHDTISPCLVSKKLSFDLSPLLDWLFQYDSALMISFPSPSLTWAFFPLTFLGALGLSIGLFVFWNLCWKMVYSFLGGRILLTWIWDNNPTVLGSLFSWKIIQKPIPERPSNLNSFQALGN